MMSKSRLTVAALLVAALPMTGTAQQAAPHSAADTARVKKEVTDAVDKYYSLFTAQNMQALPEQVYSIPWILMTARGPQADLTNSDAGAAAFMNEAIDQARRAVDELIRRTGLT
jgi:hypothetical protein